jgi:phosphoribosylaminoimidazole-succinocarboxamide synthase
MEKAVNSVSPGGRLADYTGKVREIFDLGDELIIVATDRISAFDVVFTEGIPEKGKILTEISNHWFSLIDFIPNHIIETDCSRFPEPFNTEPLLSGRSVLVKKAERVDVECIVRGYLAGSGYKDYKKSGKISGHTLPDGLQIAQELPEPIFTPSTKADVGHDENITRKEMVDAIGAELSRTIEELSLKIYTFAHDLMRERGIILADTKFEFGIRDGAVILIDEALTPDSSRYWPMGSYEIGQSPPSFDKQYVRDFLETSDWDKTPPAPPLPDEIIQGTLNRYREILEIIKGIG